MLLALLGCTPAPSLAFTGLDGATVDPVGFWVREELTFEVDGHHETLHQLVLTSGVDPCANWLQDLPEADPPTGDPVADCEAAADWYGATGEAMGAWADAGAFVVGFDLWGEDGGGTEPTDGTFTPLDGPDADRIEWAGWGERNLIDWYAAVASGLDCAVAETGDPWATVPSQLESSVRYDLPAGTIALDARPDVVLAELDTVTLVVDDVGAAGEDGTLTGTARFEACDVDRFIEETTITD